MKIKKIQRKLIPIVIAILVTAIAIIVIINKKENNSYKDNKIIKENTNSLKNIKYDSDGYAINSEDIGKLKLYDYAEQKEFKTTEATITNINIYEKAFVAVADYILEEQSEYNAYSYKSYVNILANYVTLMCGKDSKYKNKDGYVYLSEKDINKLSDIVFGKGDFSYDDIEGSSLITKKDGQYAVKLQEISEKNVQINSSVVDEEGRYYIEVSFGEEKTEYILENIGSVVFGKKEYNYSITNAKVL